LITTLLIKGHNAYGWLKTESGVHRLVRISPYDSNARDVLSARARRPVGVDPAVRFLDLDRDPVVDDRIDPGIVVACQQERSQHKNRATAWNMLRARLYELELKMTCCPPAPDDR
jgi:peptide chain release factor 2